MAVREIWRSLVTAHRVFVPFISLLTRLDAQALSGLLEHVKGWIRRG